MKHAEEEFLGILSAYQGIIHKVSLIYFRSETDREDNFQEVVCQLWRAFPTLKNKEKPASWIYAVAINTSISKIRKDSRVEYRASVPDVIAAEENEDESNYRQLIEALYGLNEIDRSIMLLYLEDCSYEEIAEIVGISVSNVGVKIHRIKDKLKQHFNG